MLFAVSCTDKADSQSLRLDNRPAHIEFLKANGAAIKVAGPYVTEDGAAMTGSLLIVEAADLAAARVLAAGDPYARAGLFESVDIRPWKWVIGNPDA